MRAAVRCRFSISPIVTFAMFATLAASSSSLGVLVAACAGDSEDVFSNDAGADAPQLGEAAMPDVAEVPIGEICGDARGLEEGAPWPMRGGCPKRSGTSSDLGPQNAIVKWSLPTPAAHSSPAVAVDGRLWLGTAAGEILAVSSTGIPVGSISTGGAVRSSPARAKKSLAVVVGGDGALYGLALDPAVDAGVDDAGDGGAVPALKTAFRRELAAAGSSPAIGSDGTIYVGTTDGKLVAVSADGSAIAWTATTNDTAAASPTLGNDGTIYVGSSDRHLYAFTPAGAPKWSFDAGGAMVGPPAVGGDDTVYVGTSEGKLHAVGPDGNAKWTYATGGAIAGSPSIRAGVVYVGSDDKKLHAVATPTGIGLWVYATLGAVGTPVIGVDGTVYVGSADRHLYAITATGLLFFAVDVKGRVRGAPAISGDGSLFVTSDTGVVAIGP